ncbi:MAG: hypothetical protein RR555_07455 [Bacteroidales bacterium]
MKLRHSHLTLLIFLLCWGNNLSAQSNHITEETITSTITALCSKHNSINKFLIEKGVRQTAGMWQADSLPAADFATFCLKNWIAHDSAKEQVLMRASDHLNNHRYISATRNASEYYSRHTGYKTAIDTMFDKSVPSFSLSREYFKNKIPYYMALNFPQYTLEEKERLGKDWSMKEWAYARMGDRFTKPEKRNTSKRIASVNNSTSAQKSASSAANSQKEDPLKKLSASKYIADYNIYMGHVLAPKGEKNFDKNMILLSHWNLRDEIKANYNKGETGLTKQRTVAKVMERIVSQEIPKEVINSGDFDWNPFINTLYKNGKKGTATQEDTVRYYFLKRNFNPDSKYGESKIPQIDAKFSGELEMQVDQVEALFETLLKSQQRIQVAEIIKKRLGRNLEAFDIWYDGFKSRSTLNMDSLDIILKKRYPNAQALEKDLPRFLETVGYDPIRAREIAWKVAVDPDQGSGHAAGASFRGAKSRLRTRFVKDGLDYKGYNIAVHEFGHNVEQTISLYEVPYLALQGVPNTAFSEAMAFIMQKRDMQILGIRNNSPQQEEMETLDAFWGAYEIMGVGMLDIVVWRWMYANPTATVNELKAAVIKLSKEVWNKYYADAFGIKDQTILAAYSHMLHYPLYLSAYPIGHLIAFQVNEYVKGKNLPQEIDRIFRLGRLTPNEWMLRATGQTVSTQPLLDAVAHTLTHLN